MNFQAIHVLLLLMIYFICFQPETEPIVYDVDESEEQGGGSDEDSDDEGDEGDEGEEGKSIQSKLWKFLTT